MTFLKNKKDVLYRTRYSKLETQSVSKKVVNSFVINTQFKTVLNKKLFISYSNKSKTKVVRYCILTGRSRGNIRSLGNVSRVILRNLLKSQLIPGYSKAVW